jgi:hypothetical protein
MKAPTHGETTQAGKQKLGQQMNAGYRRQKEVLICGNQRKSAAKIFAFVPWRPLRPLQ